MKSVPVIPLQVTLLLPWLMAPGLEHEISTTVPGSTGKSVVVSIVLVHSVLSPVHSTGKFDLIKKNKCRLIASRYD